MDCCVHWYVVGSSPASSVCSLTGPELMLLPAMLPTSTSTEYTVKGFRSSNTSLVSSLEGCVVDCKGDFSRSLSVGSW